MGLPDTSLISWICPTFGTSLNSLIPRKLAVAATPQAIAAYEKLQTERKAQTQKQRDVWQQALARISESGLTVSLSADDGGHLYKKLDARTLAQLFTHEGLSVQPASVELAKPITTCGEHTVAIVTKEGKGAVTVTVRALSKKRA